MSRDTYSRVTWTCRSLRPPRNPTATGIVHAARTICHKQQKLEIRASSVRRPLTCHKQKPNSDAPSRAICASRNRARSPCDTLKGRKPAAMLGRFPWKCLQQRDDCGHGWPVDPRRDTRVSPEVLSGDGRCRILRPRLGSRASGGHVSLLCGGHRLLAPWMLTLRPST